MKMQCPNVVAAGIKLAEHEKAANGKDLWMLGDALVRDCGRGEEPSSENTKRRNGAHNGSKADIEVAQRELAAVGITYTVGTLTQIRQIAMTFPKEVEFLWLRA
jgi:hypothetical protein